MVFESNKVVTSKNDMYIGKGYMCDGLFKFHILEYVITKSNYHYFEHVSSHNIRRMVNLSLMLKYDVVSPRCEIRVQAAQKSI